LAQRARDDAFASVSWGGNQGRSEPAESRLQPGLAAPQSSKPQTVWAFSGIMSAAGRRITNPPQVTNLPHMSARRKLGAGEIVAARDEWNG